MEPRDAGPGARTPRVRPGSAAARTGRDHAGFSPSSLAGFVAEFMDALGIERAPVVGNSLGGLVSLRLALSRPSRVSALGLVDSAGLGREVTPRSPRRRSPASVRRLSSGRRPRRRGSAVPGEGPAPLRRPHLGPAEWLAEQARLGLSNGFMETTLAALRSHIGPAGQKGSEILLDELPRLEMPTLVVWGALDKVVPLRHAHDAVARLRHGNLEILPGCGHLPHVECPGRFAEVLNRFLDG
ncbi:alpha/beta fold hydrolase [Rubrobacter marinus]|uniref:alpha/beta fold hydrolase n=1 Tax=Rubrobacter marinus TaxID=2653852 RepID=UPI001A9D7A06|nr:alpha/beta fold hydrolase [Rubrobacter marinus]